MARNLDQKLKSHYIEANETGEKNEYYFLFVLTVCSIEIFIYFGGLCKRDPDRNGHPDFSLHCIIFSIIYEVEYLLSTRYYS